MNRAPSQMRFFGGCFPGPVQKGKSSFFFDISNRVRMFSFAGDIVLDPFAGSGTPNLAALRNGAPLHRRRDRAKVPRHDRTSDASAAWRNFGSDRSGASASRSDCNRRCIATTSRKDSRPAPEVRAVDLPTAMRLFRARHPRASNRQEDIQLYCVQELTKRGLIGASIEVIMPGFYRAKAWDVGLIVDGEPRLGISCKSIISNHAGTVPNRVDDMLGEAVSLHRAHPRAVLGYLFMMSRLDESKATQATTTRLASLVDSPSHAKKLIDIIKPDIIFG